MEDHMWVARRRGEDWRSGGLFSYVDLEARVPADHPLRPIRAIVDDALRALSGEFAALYSHLGRPSITPERLLLTSPGNVATVPAGDLAWLILSANMRELPIATHVCREHYRPDVSMSYGRKGP